MCWVPNKAKIPVFGLSHAPIMVSTGQACDCSAMKRLAPVSCDNHPESGPK
jgi:hypothetical protein